MRCACGIRLSCAIGLGVVFVSAPAAAADYTLSPGVGQGAVAAQLDKLAPGDTLTLAPGDYSGIDLDLKHANGSGIAGTSSQPITIVGTPDASGNLPHIIADTGGYQEGVRLRPGSAYITIKRLHISTVGSTTQAGVFFDSNVHDVQIVDNVIENVTGIGVQMHSQSDIHDVLVEHNEITNTGTNVGDGNNGGQGFQAGGFAAGQATQNVYHLVVRRNLIHGIRGQEGECLALLYGVYASTLEDNVMYDCPRGVSGETENYGIAVYGSGAGHYTNTADDNVIQRNLVLGSAATQSGHSNVGIYVGPGTRVLDNVIVTANQGIAARLESEASTMRNLRVVNNTVYSVTDYAFSIRGCQTADSSVVVTGNALVAATASGFGYRMPDPVGGMIAKANYYSGQDYAEASPPVMNKLTAAPSALFVNASTTVPGADFMPAPGSPLIDKADGPTAPSVDFDLAPRPSGGGPDVGAYESGASGSHWALALGFKGSYAAGGLESDGGVVTDPTAPGGPGSSSGSASSSSGGPGSSADSGSGCGCTAAPRANALWPWLALAALGWRRRRRP